MRVLLAGATGALGRRLVPMLINSGFEVTGTTRSAARIAELEAVGASGVQMDGLDETSVKRAMSEAEPEVVIHQLTSLAAMSGNTKKFDQEFAATNRLRTTGTDNLLAAAHGVGATRFIAQNYAGWPSERRGGWVKDETDPLDASPAAESASSHAAIRHVDEVVPGAEGIDGIVLRYGGFYGPGTGMGAGGEMLNMVAERKMPIVGGGTGVWSFCHIDDAAAATVAAVIRGAPGIYNIVDDEPAPMSEWLPHLAASIGAKPPRRLPAWLARPMLGEHGISLMTQIRGASNVKAKTELEWHPRYPSWREGFRTGLGDATLP